MSVSKVAGKEDIVQNLIIFWYAKNQKNKFKIILFAIAAHTDTHAYSGLKLINIRILRKL